MNGTSRYQFRIWHMLLATGVSAALLGWWRLFGVAWIGPFVLALSVFLGVVALVDAFPREPLRVAKFFGSAVGLQLLVLFAGFLYGMWFIVVPIYYPVYLSLSAFTGGDLNFANRPLAFALQTFLGVLSYATAVSGAWAWWMGYANSEI